MNTESPSVNTGSILCLLITSKRAGGDIISTQYMNKNSRHSAAQVVYLCFNSHVTDRTAISKEMIYCHFTARLLGKNVDRASDRILFLGIQVTAV